MGKPKEADSNHIHNFTMSGTPLPSSFDGNACVLPTLQIREMEERPSRN